MTQKFITIVLYTHINEVLLIDILSLKFILYDKCASYTQQKLILVKEDRISFIYQVGEDTSFHNRNNYPYDHQEADKENGYKNIDYSFLENPNEDEHNYNHQSTIGVADKHSDDDHYAYIVLGVDVHLG